MSFHEAQVLGEPVLYVCFGADLRLAVRAVPDHVASSQRQLELSLERRTPGRVGAFRAQLTPFQIPLHRAEEVAAAVLTLTRRAKSQAEGSL